MIITCLLYSLKCVKTGTQWTRAKQADCVLLLMDAILMALLENSRQCTVWLGQRCVYLNVTETVFHGRVAFDTILSLLTLYVIFIHFYADK